MDSPGLFQESVKHFPGGVNSPVRFFSPGPIYMEKGKGSRIYDTEGKEYIDYLLGFGPMILGHSNRDFNERLKRRVEDGVLFGTPTEGENRLASLITDGIPSIEKMRFTNSGTEATMHAIRLARAFTGRDIILKMEGGYHGAHDYSLIKSGSGTLTFGTPSSPGVPEEISKTVALGEYNNIQSIKDAFSRIGNRIAAVITEPVMGNVGVIPPEEGFLQELREITEKNGSLLILDEVITGFRFGYHGYQKMAGVTPDLTTLGKIIGGGLPIGLFGGRADIMDQISPAGKVYEAGTFSGNPMSVAGGTATLEILRNSDYSIPSGLAGKLSSGILDIAGRVGEDVQVNRIGTVFQAFFNSRPVRKYSDAAGSDAKRYFSLFTNALKEGVYLPPSQFETGFMSFAHSSRDVENTLAALESAWKK